MNVKSMKRSGAGWAYSCFRIFAFMLFVPAFAHSVEVVLPLTKVDPQTIAVECTLDGRKCQMAFDTGSPATFFHKNFIDGDLPDADLAATGRTNYMINVFGRSYRITPREFLVGEIPWPATSYGVIEHDGTNKMGLVGVLGMEFLWMTPGNVIVSVGDGKVTFFPSKEDMAGFGEPVGVWTNGHMFVTKEYRGKPLRLLLDTGSGETYLTESTGWPKTPFGYVAYGNNYAGEVEIPGSVGELGSIDLGGMPFEMQPNVIAHARNDLIPCEDIAIVGLDTLKRYDILVAGDPSSRTISLRPNASVPPRSFVFTASMCQPKTDADREFSIPVVAHTNGYAVIECEIDGKPCRMVVCGRDGISFIDSGFVGRAFPDAKLLPPSECAMWQPEYSGISGRMLRVGSMKVGGVVFTDFVMRLGETTKEFGFPVDGVLDLSTLKDFMQFFVIEPGGGRRIVLRPIARGKAAEGVREAAE